LFRRIAPDDQTHAYVDQAVAMADQGQSSSLSAAALTHPELIDAF